MKITTPFGRIGSKRPVRELICNKIPQHKIYCEPFVGSGAVFFYKKKVNLEIINDKDEKITEAFRHLKNCSDDIEKYNFQKGLENIQLWSEQNHTTHEDNFLKYLYILNNTFGNIGKGKIYKNITHETKLTRNIVKYTERLKDTIILNKDYKDVIEDYDSEDTFFYIDPPYYNPKKYSFYKFDSKQGQWNWDDFLNILKNIKGKFILSLNDDVFSRNLFKDFNIEIIDFYSNTRGNMNLGGDRKELLITNF